MCSMLIIQESNRDQWRARLEKASKGECCSLFLWPKIWTKQRSESESEMNVVADAHCLLLVHSIGLNHHHDHDHQLEHPRGVHFCPFLCLSADGEQQREREHATQV